MKKVAIVLGTRPEAIKLIPVYFACKQEEGLDVMLISTGQHKEMLTQIFNVFGVTPDVELGVMSNNQSLSGLTAILFDKLGQTIAQYRPDIVVVQGDTTSAMVGSMVGFYHKALVAHVEAGLRTYDKYSPFPEEVNRKVISGVADFHFTPTRKATEALQREEVKGIYQVGNTVVDSLMLCKEKVHKRDIEYRKKFGFLSSSKKMVLVTGHRRENFGKGFEQICSALSALACKYEAQLEFVYPVHLNPNVKEVVYKTLSEQKNIHLLEPLPYDELIYLMSRAYIILTDSGGIQEEAPSFDSPVIVTREKTERPEGVEAGCSVLAGTEKDSIVAVFEKIFTDHEAYNRMASVDNPYGDGVAAKRIAEILSNEA